MIEVRVRHVNDVTSVYLATVEFNALDDVIPTIRRWGGFCPTFERENLSGQLVYDPEKSPREAYFEVLIDD